MLLVGDHDGFAAALRDALAAHGYRSSRAASGGGAVVALKDALARGSRSGRAWTAVVVVLSVISLSGCGSDEAPLPPRSLRIATGNAGGVYAAYGEGLAGIVNRRLPRLRASVLHTDGSVANLRRLATGRAEVAFTLADSAADALRGAGRFSERVSIAAVARLYDNYVQLIVGRDAKIGRVEDLAGRDISIGAPGSGTALIAQRVLKLAHLVGAQAPRRRTLDVDRSAAALASGQIAAFFWSGGLPTPAIERLARNVPIKLLDMGGVGSQLNRRYGDLYTQTRIPRTAYGRAGAVRTVSVANFLVVRRDLDDETAYRLTRLLFERHDELKRAHPEAARLNARAAIATSPVALHRGARRWYQQARR
ncbi:MAG TPA: TAXI family TRAP transporter solute-binding subunit [Solirubrobacteraceae bacterium]